MPVADGLFRRLAHIRRLCRQADAAFVPTLARGLYAQAQGRHVLAHPNTVLHGLANIHMTPGARLEIGMDGMGFLHRSDASRFSIAGCLNVDGFFWFGKGSRVDIGPGATLSVKNGYVTGRVLVLVRHSLTIGDDCAISWGCQFLDDDLHTLHYEGRQERPADITIGDHVWIGSNVSVLKGARIPSGCVVASGAIVTRAFDEENALLAGSPARVIKHDVRWE